MKLGSFSALVASATYAFVAIAGLSQTSCSVLGEALDELDVIRPALAQTAGFQVFIRDEALHDPNHSQPRIYVKNASPSQSYSNFKVHYYFTVENGGVPVLGVYWAPGSQVSMQQVQGNIWRVVYDFNGTTLGPGQLVPDSSGNVIGLNNTTYTEWNESNDWSAYGVTSAFKQTFRVVVVSASGEVLYGQLPPQLPPPGDTGSTSTSSSTSTTSSTNTSSTNTSSTTTSTSGSSSSTATSSDVSSDSGEETDPDDGASVTFRIKHPRQLRREDIALGTTGGNLAVNDGVRVLGMFASHASISAVDGGKVSRLGVHAEAWGVYGEQVTIADEASIFGDVVGGTLTIADSAEIYGDELSNVSFEPLRTIQWAVAFPTVVPPELLTQPDTTLSLPPGDYGATTIERGVQLTLSPGIYTFDKLTAEPDSVFNIQNADGPVFLYVRKNFTFRGVQNLAVDQANVLLGAAGMSKSIIERSWSSIVVVPNGELELATLAAGDYYSGAFFAKKLVVQPHTDLLHQPFSPASFCNGGEDCSSFCPCEEGEQCKASVVGACADDLLCAVVSGEDGICAPAACANSQGELQCGPGCPCGSNVGCQSDDECDEGRVCVPGWGAFFNQPKTSAACVPPACLVDMSGAECRLVPAACNSDEDCGPFGSCSASASAAFGSGEPKTCWSKLCEEPGFACGSSAALCGECQCEGSCSHVTSCGDELFNGCDGLCPTACESGSVGCKYDVDCPESHTCMAKAGAYFGGNPSEGVCLPDQCLTSISPQDCASTDSLCGTFCGGVPPDACAGRECGVSPESGAVCGTCASGASCGFDGLCSLASQQPSPLQYVRAKTDEVGTIPGSPGVSATGKFSYSVPLKLPPGAGGFAPSLGLRFQDEANVRGSLGPGWSLEGFSRIHRCSAVALQLEHLRPQQALPLGLCLDGKLLVESGNENEYRVDDAPAVKVVRKGQDSSLGEETWFQVLQPNGTVNTYGEYSSARAVAARVGDGDLDATAIGQWAIENSVDRFGNRITFKYDGSSGRWAPSELNPSEIYYSYRQLFGNLADTPGRRVRFVYTAKEDSLGDAIGYRFGVPQSDTKLLTRIVVDTYDTSLLSEGDGYDLLEARSYELEYAPAPISKLQTLRSVTECTRGSDSQNHCLPPTVFAYDDVVQEVDGAPVWGDVNRFGAGNDDAIPGLPEPSALSFRTPNARPYRSIVFDGDGDGNKEILRQTNPPFKLDPTYVWSKKNSSNGFEYGEPVQVEYEGVGYACLSGSAVGDIDRDGADELLNQCSFGHRDTIQYISYKDGVLRGVDTTIPALAPAYLADINGDGLLDVVQESGAYLLVSMYHGMLDDVAVFSDYKVPARGEPSPTEPTGFWNQNENPTEQGMKVVHPFLMDVDGDGVSNLLRYDAAGEEFLALRLVATEELTEDEQQYADDPSSEGCKLYDAGCAPLGKGAFALNIIGRWESTGLSFRQIASDGRAASERLRILDVNADGLPDVLNAAITTLTPMTEERLCEDLPWYWRVIGLKPVCQGAPIGYGAILASGFLPLERGEPAEMWINEGGKFSRKQVLSSEDWRPEFGQCKEKSEGGLCPTWFSTELFSYSTVMDFDHDGKEDLVTLDPTSSEEVRWSVVRFDANGNNVLADIRQTSTLPQASRYFFEFQDYARRAFFYPLWSDFNGDSEIDVLFTGRTEEDQRLQLGLNNKKGQRMVGVTDGLGNQVSVYRAAGAAIAEVGSGCEGREDEIPSLAPHRCLSQVGKLVQAVGLTDSAGNALQTTTYSYHRPRTAAFQRGAQFVERRTAIYADNIDEEELPAETITETYGNLSPGTGVYFLEPSGWQYPFAGAPTTRVVSYGAASDVLGGEFARRVEEQYLFEAYAMPMPVLSEKRTTIFDAISETDFAETTATVESYSYDGDSGLPQTKVSDTYVAGRNEPGDVTSHVREYWGYKEYDESVWILTDVDVHSITSERNGVELTPAFTTSVYDDTSRRLVTRSDYMGDGITLETSYVFDDYGNLSEEVKREVSNPGLAVRRTVTDYGERGLFPESIENAEGHRSQLRFDDLSGQPSVKIDANGYRTETVYDGLGRATKIIDVSGETNISYVNAEPLEVDGVALPARYKRVVTREYAAPATEVFDSRGQSLQNDTPGLAVGGQTPRLLTETAWDWRGRAVRQSAPHEAGEEPVWTRTRYDNWGRVTRVEGPLGTTNYGYSSIARFADQIPEWAFTDAVALVVEKDSEGYQVARVMGPDAQPVATADGVSIAEGSIDTGLTTRIVRGGMGLPVAIIDPEGLETVSSYSDVGLLKTRQDLDRGLLVNSYNAFGETIKIVKPGTSPIVLAYDRLGRLTNRSDADGVSTWVYDSADGSGIGKIAVTTSPFDVEVRYAYEEESRGLLVSTTHIAESQASAPLVATTSLEYDDFGRLIHTTYPVVPGFELVAETEYDSHSGAVTEVGSLDGSVPWWSAAETDARGRITEVQLGNGVRQEVDFDADKQLLKAITYSVEDGDVTLGSVNLKYYANGLLHERDVVVGDEERARAITYDASRRIHVVDEDGDDSKSEEFQFSPNGRLLFRSSLGTYTYDDVNHPRAVTGAGDTEFAYDARGNQNLRMGELIEGGEQRVTHYTSFDLPLALAVGADEQTPAASYAFSYDANQKRVLSLEEVSGTRTFVAGSAYERTSTGSDVTHKFRVFVAGTAVAEVHYEEGAPDSKTVYLHRDGAGSVLFTSNDDGEPSALRDFDVYGAPTAEPAWSAQISDSFTSHRFEPGFGLIDMGARFYDPTFGVFTSADPLTTSGAGSQATNPFAYANNDPVNLYDPLGLQAEKSSVSDSVIVTVYGAPLYPTMTLDLWAVPPPPVSFDPNYPLQEYYTYNSPGQPLVVCDMNGQCSGGTLGSTLIAPRGDSYSINGRKYQLTMNKIALALFPVPVAAINTATDATEAPSARILATGIAVAALLGGKVVDLVGDAARGGVTLYHGTSVKSAGGLLAGEGLDASKAAAQKIDGAPGFFLATHADDAAYFASRRGEGTILEVRLSQSAAQQLNLNTSPLGPLGRYGSFAGSEAVIPVQSFELFNSLRSSGDIVVVPFRW